MNHVSQIKAAVENFRSSWNKNDLGELHAYIAKDVVCKYPAVNVGFVKMLKGNHEGYFLVLKFWEQLFIDFNVRVEDVNIESIESMNTSYKVKCSGHYPFLKISANFFVMYNSNFLIDRIEFTRITDYRIDKKMSRLGMVVTYIKGRFNKRQLV